MLSDVTMVHRLPDEIAEIRFPRHGFTIWRVPDRSRILRWTRAAGTWSKLVEWCLGARRHPVSSVILRSSSDLWDVLRPTLGSRPEYVTAQYIRTRDSNPKDTKNSMLLSDGTRTRPVCTAGTNRTGFTRFTTSGSADPPIRVLAPPARRIGRPRRHASGAIALARTLTSSRERNTAGPPTAR